MAWTYETFDGLSIHPLCTTVQSELIRAINERKEAIGAAADYYFCGDGTEMKQYPEPADFDGFPLLGDLSPISTPLALNMKQIASSIAAICPRFLVTRDGTEQYGTVDALRLAAGYDEWQSSFYNFRNATAWQRLKDCLDKLLYYRLAVTPSSKTRTYKHTEYTLPFTPYYTVPFDGVYWPFPPDVDDYQSVLDANYGDVSVGRPDGPTEFVAYSDLGISSSFGYKRQGFYVPPGNTWTVYDCYVFSAEAAMSNTFKLEGIPAGASLYNTALYYYARGLNLDDEVESISAEVGGDGISITPREWYSNAAGQYYTAADTITDITTYEDDGDVCFDVEWSPSAYWLDPRSLYDVYQKTYSAYFYIVIGTFRASVDLTDSLTDQS